MSNTPKLLTPAEVASLFRVDPKTVSRWALAGKLTRTRTPGGHSRFTADSVRALLVADGLTPADAAAAIDAAVAANRLNQRSRTDSAEVTSPATAPTS